MNPNSDLKNNESVMAVNAESSTIKAANAESSTVGAGYAESRISEYAARFAAYSDERLKQTIDHERKVRGWGSERSYFLAALRGECEKRGILLYVGIDAQVRGQKMMWISRRRKAMQRAAA